VTTPAREIFDRSRRGCQELYREGKLAESLRLHPDDVATMWEAAPGMSPIVSFDGQELLFGLLLVEDESVEPGHPLVTSSLPRERGAK
jgi:hypothetical protein